MSDSRRLQRQEEERDDLRRLQRQYLSHLWSMYLEGWFGDEFKRIMQVRDEGSPNFVLDIVTRLLDRVNNIIHEMELVLQQGTVDYRRLFLLCHQFKGSTLCTGTVGLNVFCPRIQSSIESKNRQGCLDSLGQLKLAFGQFRQKISQLLRLEQEIMAARGSVPRVR